MTKTQLLQQPTDDGNVTITPQEFGEILTIQQTILSMVASKTPSDTILAKLCQLAETLLDNSVASIMLKDDKSHLLNVLSAPSIPKQGINALAGLEPGPGGGSCGNAVFRNESQFVTDTFTDDRWCDLRDIAYDFNLCSCWSNPIRNSENQAIGSFALSSFEHRSPSAFHKKLLENCAYLTAIILKNQKLSDKTNIYASALMNGSDPVCITDHNNLVIEVNQAFEELMGYQEHEILGKNPMLYLAKTPNDALPAEISAQLLTNQNWNGELVIKSAQGKLLTQWVKINAIKNDANDVVNYLAIFSDIDEIAAYQKKITHMAFHDSLTELKNKSSLETTLKKYANKLHPDNIQNLTLILLNVNNFGYINTSYGFNIGDKLLTIVAKTLTELTHNAFVYRINADEFALLFSDEVNATAIINEIQAHFYETTIFIDGISLHISCNYGVAFGKESLFKNAAQALKQAKGEGKNKYHVYNKSKDSIDNNIRGAFVKYNNILHDAIVNQTVIPYFQGIRSNTLGQVTKYEVLARINHNGEILTPFHFLEAAKLSGMLPEITKIMIDKSFQTMKDNLFDFSINITEDDLSYNYLCDYLLEKSTQYGISPSRVILELLENVSASGKSAHINQLNLLKKHGFLLAIDDFGSEYSNFERVLNLDIDFLKIDARYIKKLDTDNKSYEITKAISSFAQNANIPCIAEFVHNKAIQAIVTELGIEYSQGYLFSIPNQTPN